MKKSSLALCCFILCLIVLSVFFIFRQVVPTVLVTQSKTGTIRDSVTGNVRVHAAATYELRAQSNAKVDWVALLPLGGTLSVDENQTLIQLELDDLDRRMDRLILDKTQFTERKKAGSPLGILLEIQEKELLSINELAKEEKVSIHNLEKKQNEVQRMRAQRKLEVLADSHFLQNFDLSMDTLVAEVEKRAIRSPIKGDFSSCFVAPGNQVFSGNIVGNVHSPERIIEVSLNEEEFLGLKVGLSAGVTFFSQGKTIFDANVSALSSTVESNSGIRKLYLRLDNSDEKIPVGSSGRAEIIKSEKEVALLIPRKALIGDFVVVEQSGVAQFRKVLIGSKNLRTVEVLKGLKKGERVVVETPHLLKDGERIKSTMVSFSN